MNMAKFIFSSAVLLSSAVGSAENELDFNNVITTPVVASAPVPVSPAAQDPTVVVSNEVKKSEISQNMDSRPWRAPDFTNQKEALGYSENGFVIPKGMEGQVQFWINVYSKYSSTEGVIHDLDNVENIYEIVDLKGLKTEKEKQKKIDQAKKAVAVRLKLDKESEDRLRFQLGQKDRMQDAIFNSGRYLEDMEKVFREAKLPTELTRLAFVESAFNVMARSKVGASGIWQIMPYTARPYRMMSAAVDKRNHPADATKLAAKLLKQNYSMLDSWPLAVTGYNHGPTGVKKMTVEYKSKDLAHLIENVDSRKSFGFASRNFYACFLAALEVERNAKKYFSEITWSKPFNSQDLKLPIPTKYSVILKLFDGDKGKAQLFNPHLNQIVTRKGHPIPAQTVISIPKEKYSVALISLSHRGRFIANDDK
jgi:membrane-bound lytic murein transglycosylase D